MELLSLLTVLVIVIGAVTFFRGLCAFFTFLRIAVSSLNKSWAEKYGKGSWAIITGCT